MKTALLQTRYDLLKKIVIDNRGAAAKFWGAITALKDEKLYLCEYKTWQEFCEKEFGFSPQYANRLIAAGEVAQSLEKDGNSEQTLTGGSKSETMVSLSLGVPNISNERQARVLAAVPPEKRAEVLEAAAARGPVTAKAIAAVAAEKSAGATEERHDAIGRVIPPEILAEWDRAVAVAARLRSCASEIKVTVERGLADKDIIFAEIFNPVVSEASGLHYTLAQIAPHAVCPTCQGRGRKTCQLCRRRGWISKFLFNSPAVSAETKAILEKAKR